MRWSVFIMLILATTLHTMAQDESSNALVFTGVQGGELHLYEFDLVDETMIAQRVLAAAETFHDVSWSPGGFVLSYLHTQSPRLEFAPRRNELTFVPLPTIPDYADPFMVATSLSLNIETSYRTTFDTEGRLYFAVRPNRPNQDRIHEDEDLFGVILDVYEVFSIDGRALKIGEIVREYGCGHTPSTPMEALLDIEDSSALLANTPDGIVFGYSCFGDGLARSNALGDFTILSENLSNSRISNGRDLVAGTIRRADNLSVDVVSIATGTSLNYPLGLPEGSTITELAWSLDDASIYYAVQEPTGLIDMDDATRSELDSLGISENLLRAYQVRLYQLDRATGDSTLLYDHPDVYAIGSLVPTESGIVFSQIANGSDAWLNHIIDTGAAYQFGSDASALADITLHYLTTDGSVIDLGTGITQVAVGEYPTSPE